MLKALSMTLALSLLSVSAHASKTVFSCAIDKLIPDFELMNSAPEFQTSEPIDLSKIPLARVEFSIVEKDGSLQGNQMITFSKSKISADAVVTKEERAYVRGENPSLDLAISDLGLSGQVSNTTIFAFGKPTHMGVEALVIFLKDQSGLTRDELVYSWGAFGHGSCRTGRVVGLVELPK